jgi:hypothetical protein
MQFGAIRDPLKWDGWHQAEALLGDEGQLLLPSLNDGLATLWVAIDGAVKMALVTELIDAPQGRECFLRLIGGHDRGEWLPFLANVIEWAKAQGCVALEGTMRPGWERVLPDWKKTAVVLRKDI